MSVNNFKPVAANAEPQELEHDVQGGGSVESEKLISVMFIDSASESSLYYNVTSGNISNASCDNFKKDIAQLLTEQGVPDVTKDNAIDILKNLWNNGLLDDASKTLLVTTLFLRFSMAFNVSHVRYYDETIPSDICVPYSVILSPSDKAGVYALISDTLNVEEYSTTFITPMNIIGSLIGDDIKLGIDIE